METSASPHIFVNIYVIDTSVVLDRTRIRVRVHSTVAVRNKIACKLLTYYTHEPDNWFYLFIICRVIDDSIDNITYNIHV